VVGNEAENGTSAKTSQSFVDHLKDFVPLSKEQLRTIKVASLKKSNLISVWKLYGGVRLWSRDYI
jgi:hypothetical protein